MTTTTWNWHWADHLDEEVDTRESPEPHLHILNYNRVKSVYYPRHPIQGVLSSNVFTASATAIQIILEPEIAVPCMPEFVDLPIVLSPPEPEQPTIKAEDAIFLNSDGTLPDYVFKYTPLAWLIQFTPSGKKPERGVFGELNGLRHYQKLLKSPDKRLSVWEIVGQPSPAALPGSTITADEYLEQFDDAEDFSGFQFEGASHEGRVDDEELARLKEYGSSLLRQLQTANDPQIKKELKKDLRTTKRLIHKRGEEIAKGNGTFAVFNTVKMAMYDCRNAIEVKKMNHLLGHLEAFVFHEGWGFAYRPQQQLPWEF